MQTYDMLMLLVLAGATIFGFWKGIAWQIASVASLVVSYFVALNFSPQLAPYFGNSAPFNRFVAMLAIYFATSFIIWMAFRMVAGAIDRVKLQEFDRQLGALLGFAKGVLFCVAITFFAVTLLPPAQKDAIVASRAGRYIVILLDKTESIVPPEINQIIGPYVRRINQELAPGRQPYGNSPQIAWPNPTGNGTANPSIAWPSSPPTGNDWPTPPTNNAWPPSNAPAGEYPAGSTDQSRGRY